jgi:probable phosphoglycerate mutase
MPWTESRQHAGRTELVLDTRGEHNARLIGERLRRNYSFDRVFTGSLQRASKACELAGYREKAEIDADLVGWDYGSFEGRRRKEIRAERPSWLLYCYGCPGGESPEYVAARTDRFIARIRDLTGEILAFSSGHVIRMIVARWLGRSPVGSFAAGSPGWACSPTNTTASTNRSFSSGTTSGRRGSEAGSARPFSATHSGRCSSLPVSLRKDHAA